MILTCPECSTNYMSKDGSIGPNGRSVRCARCETVWFVEGIDPDAMALHDNQAVQMVPESQSDVISEPQADLPFVPDRPAPTSAPAPVGAHTLLRNKADAEKLAKRKSLIRRIWTIPVMLVLTGIIFGIAKRQAIVEKFPSTATLYSALGMTVKSNGLDVRGLESQRLVIDGEPILRVTGEVVNLTPQAITAPLVQFQLENRSGEALASWFVEPGTVGAGQSVNIETDYPVPPIDGVELRYRFVPEGE